MCRDHWLQGRSAARELVYASGSRRLHKTLLQSTSNHMRQKICSQGFSVTFLRFLRLSLQGAAILAVNFQGSLLPAPYMFWNFSVAFLRSIVCKIPTAITRRLPTSSLAQILKRDDVGVMHENEVGHKGHLFGHSLQMPNVSLDPFNGFVCIFTLFWDCSLLTAELPSLCWTPDDSCNAPGMILHMKNGWQLLFCFQQGFLRDLHLKTMTFVRLICKAYFVMTFERTR